jgi:hypothetical protein
LPAHIFYCFDQSLQCGITRSKHATAAEGEPAAQRATSWLREDYIHKTLQKKGCKKRGTIVLPHARRLKTSFGKNTAQNAVR